MLIYINSSFMASTWPQSARTTCVYALQYPRGHFIMLVINYWNRTWWFASMNFMLSSFAVWYTVIAMMINICPNRSNQTGTEDSTTALSPLAIVSNWALISVHWSVKRFLNSPERSLSFILSYSASITLLLTIDLYVPSSGEKGLTVTMLVNCMTPTLTVYW